MKLAKTTMGECEKRGAVWEGEKEKVRKKELTAPHGDKNILLMCLWLKKKERLEGGGVNSHRR